MFWICVTSAERVVIEEIRKAGICRIINHSKPGLVEQFILVNKTALEAKKNKLKIVYTWCCETNTKFISDLSLKDLTHLKVCLPILLGSNGLIALTKVGHAILDTKNLLK